MRERARMNRARRDTAYRSLFSYSEYLNSGIDFSWSLVALIIAWSGYQRFFEELIDEDDVPVAAPVVVVAGGVVEEVVPDAGALEAVLDCTG